MTKLWKHTIQHKTKQLMFHRPPQTRLLMQRWIFGVSSYLATRTWGLSKVVVFLVSAACLRLGSFDENVVLQVSGLIPSFRSFARKLRFLIFVVQESLRLAWTQIVVKWQEVRVTLGHPSFRIASSFRFCALTSLPTIDDLVLFKTLLGFSASG